MRVSRSRSADPFFATCLDHSVAGNRQALPIYTVHQALGVSLASPIIRLIVVDFRCAMFVALALLCFTPFVKIEKSVFVQTFGFVFLYLSFAIILVYFLLKQDITIRLSNIFSRRIVQLVSKIGYCSYAIYLLHLAVNYVFKTFTRLYFDFQINPILSFSITSFVSISLGIMMTYTLESYFLKLRDKRFPSRST